ALPRQCEFRTSRLVEVQIVGLGSVEVFLFHAGFVVSASGDRQRAQARRAGSALSGRRAVQRGELDKSIGDADAVFIHDGDGDARRGLTQREGVAQKKRAEKKPLSSSSHGRNRRAELLSPIGAQSKKGSVESSVKVRP